MGKQRQAGRVARAIARAFDEAKRPHLSVTRRASGPAKGSGRGTVFYLDPREIAPGVTLPDEVERRVARIRLRTLTAPIIARLEEHYRNQGLKA